MTAPRRSGFVLWTGPTPETINRPPADVEVRALGTVAGRPLHLLLAPASRPAAWLAFSASKRSLIVGTGSIGLSREGLPGTDAAATLVDGLERDGLDFLAHCQGDFGAAFVQLDSGETTAIRDALGVRALYRCKLPHGNWAVASQVRSFSDFGLLRFDLDPDGLRSFLHFGSVYAPATVARGVTALPPGGIARWGPGGDDSHTRWWEPPVPDRTLDPGAAVDCVRDALVASLTRLSAPADRGATMISGGMDSSALVLLQQELGLTPLRTLSLSFRGDEHDLSEHPYQQRIVDCVGSEHHEVTIGPETLAVELDAFIDAMDQPTIDGFNTFVVARGAQRSGWTHSISGFGADELFGGYDDFHRLARHRHRLGQVQGSAARAFRSGAALLTPLVRRTRSVRLAKLDQLLRKVHSLEDYYVLVRSLFLPDQLERLTGMPTSLTDARLTTRSRVADDSIERWGQLELSNHLPNMLLRSCDQFGCGGEIRLPFLDRRVAEAVLRVPGSVRVRPGEQKPLLRDTLRGRLPAFTWQQRKRHFHVPLERWGLDMDRGATLAGILDDRELGHIADRYRRRPSVRHHTRAWALWVLDRYLAARAKASGVAARAA